MDVNIKYKDSVFSFLFSNPDVLRELYCALDDVTLPPDVPVTINTLQDVLFMDRVNDISFEIGGKLVILIEHQSTINPNMALRLLMYVARVYEKIIGDKNIYSAKPVHLPRPEFFVLYNGTAPYPDEKVLKLSELFESVASLGLSEESPALELEVKVININQGRNEKITRRCRTLGGYSAFVMKVQEYVKGGKEREEAIRQGVLYCREHDILKEFFEEHGTEVINMLMTEWNMDDALAVRYEEGIELGLEQGMANVARNALAKGIPPDLIREITGLDVDTITNLQVRQ
jgi:predicted transposase/invertase (TIGR01784 family)